MLVAVATGKVIYCDREASRHQNHPSEGKGQNGGVKILIDRT